MLPEIVVSKRFVRDHMIAKGLQPHTIKIDKPIMLAAKGARQKYTLYLEEQTKIKASDEEARRAVHLSTDINKIKVKCDQFKKAISMMESEFVDCITMAEKKNNMSYAIKGNALKRKSEKTSEELKLLEKKLLVLEEKKKNYYHEFSVAT